MAPANKNRKTVRNMNKAFTNKSVVAMGNPFVLGKMKANSSITSRKQYVNALVKSQMITQEAADKYFQLMSNNSTLSANQKRNLKPWSNFPLKPTPPPGLKPRPPPGKKTMKAPTTPTSYSSNNNVAPRSRNSVHSSASEPRNNV